MFERPARPGYSRGMSEVQVNSELVGKRVCNAARPEWGAGEVLRVQEVSHAGNRAHRVSIQFAVGHKTMLVPPARLSFPGEEQQRQAGWLDQLGHSTLDDVLRGLPESATDVLGTLRDRLAAVLPLYAYTDEPAALVTWARRQSGVADPLSHWNRDELGVAFAAFRAERDAHFRGLAAQLKFTEGPEALREMLDTIPEALRPAVNEALARVI